LQAPGVFGLRSFRHDLLEHFAEVTDCQ
jgi:hypothetical protein